MPRSRPTEDRPEIDPVASRIRNERLRQRLTLSELARSASRALGATAGPRGRRRRASVSSSYLCLIEKGRKVPDEPIAVAIAGALGDDVALYRAWVRARKRADLPSALAAAETLGRLLADRAGIAAREPVVLERPGGSERAGSAWLRLPVIPEGVDPGDGVRPSCEVIEWLRLDPERLPTEWRDRLDRPFAMRLTLAGARRVSPFFSPGDDAMVLREFMPLRHDMVYAVRHGHRVLLSRVLWNGSHLLLLPAEGASDFLLLEAGDTARLRNHVLGLAVAARAADPGSSHVAP